MEARAGGSGLRNRGSVMASTESITRTDAPAKGAGGKSASVKAEPEGFGTFGGVFTPCTLTILGVIMFLRFGSVVGEAGWVRGLAIVLAAKLITVLTTLSLSAIATNTRVQGGGAYYLISRSLGVEFGGAIGLVFYLAQAISVAMYVMGFAEALRDVAPAVDLRAAATLTNVVVFICVLIGAGWTIRLQYGILALIGLSLLSFYIGAFDSFDPQILAQNRDPHFSEGQNLFLIFALFFPAVTGIMAGANMSGDLKDPGRSIPVGTILAIVATAAIYLSMTVLIAGAKPHQELVGNGQAIGEISHWPLLITVGVFAATLSSALGSMMGAPRILQALARDDVFRPLRYFGALSGVAREPRRATVLTFLIAQSCIVLASLDTIAPLITMFFLITYGLLNLATFYEGITKNPSYRPRFRWSHWTTSLLGAIGCVGVMVLIHWVAAISAIVVIAGLHWWIGRSEVEARWGDLQSGLLFERTRKNLLRLEHELQHPKNWRPIILALSGAGWSRPHLAIFGHRLTTGQGILSLGQVIIGEPQEKRKRAENQEKILTAMIQERDIEGFPAVAIAPELSSGIETLIQCHGLGSLRPNTVLLGYPRDPERVQVFGETLRSIADLGRSTVILRHRDESDPWEAPAGTIDVWWRGRKNGELMLLLAHLLQRNPDWRARRIRLLRVIENEAGREEVQEHLESLIEQSRIRAEAIVVVSSDPRGAIRDTSSRAAITFFGFEPPSEGGEEAWYHGMERWAGDLPRVLLVNSAGGMSLES